MAAQNDQNSVNQKVYIHAYRENKHQAIFTDKQDYEAFVNFLKGYFYDKDKIDDRKKTFTIRGKTYKGLPYQTYNFFNQIELLAYKLEPNRFDLLLNEIVPGSTEKFIRAISTRYALYFNRKHNHTGSLFHDPYNLKKVNGQQELTLLIQDLHSNFSKKDNVANHYYSSYPEYLDQRVTEWINSREILSTDLKENQKLILEENRPSIVNNTQTAIIKPKPRILEIILSAAILFFFTSSSLYNIEKSTIKSKSFNSSPPTAQSQVSGAKDVKLQTPTQEFSSNQDANITGNQEKKGVESVVIKISDGNESIELRKLPTNESEIVSTAKDGEVFEVISIYPEWYEIKLDNSKNAFVSEKYSELITGNIED